MRNRTRWFWRIAAITSALALVMPISAAMAQAGPPLDTIAADQRVLQSQTGDVVCWANDTVKMRAGPAVTFAEVNKIPYGLSAPAVGRNANTSWLFVEYGGARGWVAIWLCNVTGHPSQLPIVDTTGEPGGAPPPVPSTPTPTPEASPDGAPPAPSAPAAPGPVSIFTPVTLKIRSGPGSNFAELGRLPFNVTLTPLGRNADGSWAFIEYNGTRGWIAAWLTQVTGDLMSLPVTNEAGSGGAVVPPPAQPGPLPPPAALGGFELGGQTHTLAQPDAMRQAGMTWVKFQHKWAPGQSPKDLVGRIEQAHANGLRVLFSIPGAEYPSSIDYPAYVQFVSGVAALGADGIEIWNEMNLDREWPAGQISPTSYVSNMLAPAYAGIKAANPGTLVIAGALAPTGVDNGFSVWSDQRYVAGMRDAGAARYMDCLGVHHNAGTTSPDAVTGHPADGGGGHYSWYFKPTFNVYSNAFPNSKLCFTELGYVSPEGYGAMPPNFWWGSVNTVAEQAEWLARAVDISQASGRVRLLIVFNVDFTFWGDDPQAGYAIVRPDGGCPACQTLHAAMTN